MKNRLFVLLAVASSTVLLFGQGSPAAGNREPALVDSPTLTKGDRERVINYLNETQKDFLAAIDGVSEAQWKFKPAPDRWSIAEVAEHIGVAESTIWSLVRDKIMKSPAAPEKAAVAKGKEEMITKFIPDRSRKAQAPEELKPTGRWATKAELVAAFETTRAEEITFLNETKEDLRSHFEEHPFLKTMDASQWLLFNGAHSKRHTAQILEVKADPGYPKS